MKKILIISDSRHVDVKSLDFGCYLAKLSNSKLTGILLDNVPTELVTDKQHKQAYFSKSQASEEQNILNDTDQAMIYFMEEATKRGVKSDVYVNKEGAYESILYESRFADMMVIAPELSFMGDADDMPSSFVKMLLARSECPVVLSPHSFEKIDEITFCYDGSSSSMFAIKQFTYLYPQFKSKIITLLEVRDSVIREADEGHMKTMAWLHSHYDNVNFHFLQGKVNEELFLYFLNKTHHFIVMGSFGRSLISNFFKRSTSERVIKTIDLPLFITHY